MKLTRKIAALAAAVLLAVSLTACSPKEWAQDTVVKLVKAMGLVEESDEEDTDTTVKASAGGSSMNVTGYATTEASSDKYMYFKVAFWELSDDQTMTSYVPDSTIYYYADGSCSQYTVDGLTAGKQYKITISYDNGNKYYVTGGLKVEGLGSTELNTYGDEETTNS